PVRQLGRIPSVRRLVRSQSRRLRCPGPSSGAGIRLPTSRSGAELHLDWRLLEFPRRPLRGDERLLDPSPISRRVLDSAALLRRTLLCRTLGGRALLWRPGVFPQRLSLRWHSWIRAGISTRIRTRQVGLPRARRPWRGTRASALNNFSYHN